MKKVQKTLTGAMAAMMATGVVATPAMAATNNTDVDALYKAAYQATQKALTEKTQAAVNEARAAIKALPAKLDWAIGEFSKQVDTVQHPILVNIVNAIKTAEKTPTQANINAAKKAIPAELTAQWKNSYSSAVDKIQQGLMNKAAEAVKKAETEKTQDAVDAAKALLADLATADSQAIKDWAKTLTTKVEAIKVYDLEVTKVDSITTTGVKVSFKALKEALREVTLEVIDNKGNKVDVDSKKVLIEGETSASFTFTTALRNRPEGVWTVNGVELDLDQINLINDVKAAKDKAALYDVLKVTDLVSNVKEANSQLYLDAIKKSPATIVTVEDLQNLIDEVNEGVLAQSDVNYLIEMAIRGTDNQFKNALLSMNLDKVNTSWLDAYREKITSNETLEDIKTSIKTVNNEKVKYDQNKNLINGKLDETKIVNNMELVEEYYVFDSKKEDEVKAKEAELNNYKLDLAIVTVNNADTQTSLKAALVNLEKVLNDKTKFEYAKSVNEDILSYYVKANLGNALSYTTIVGEGGVLDQGYQAALHDSINKVAEKAKVIVDAGNKVTDTQKNDLLNAYTNLAKVTVKAEVKFDNSKVKAELVVEYAKKATSRDSVEAINDYIKAVNEDTVKNTLDKVSGNELTLLEALKELGVKNLVDSNEKKYEAEYTAAGLETSKWTVALLQNKVDATNSLVKLVDSKDVTVVKNELTNIALKDTSISDFVNKKDLEKQDIAEVLIKLIADKTVTITELSQLKDGVNKATEKLNEYIGAFNKVTNKSELTISATKAALEDISSEYKALDGVKKVTIAEKFNSNRKTEKDSDKLVKLNNLTEIRTLLAECMK